MSRMLRPRPGPGNWKHRPLDQQPAGHRDGLFGGSLTHRMQPGPCLGRFRSRSEGQRDGHGYPRPGKDPGPSAAWRHMPGEKPLPAIAVFSASGSVKRGPSPFRFKWGQPPAAVLRPRRVRAPGGYSSPHDCLMCATPALTSSALRAGLSSNTFTCSGRTHGRNEAKSTRPVPGGQ